MIVSAQGAYLSPTQLSQLERYHRSLALRTQTYQSVEKLEAQIIAELSRRLKQNNPQWAQRFNELDQSKCVRDSTDILRNCALAMLLDDQEYLYDHMLHWLRTILVSLDHLALHQQIYAPLRSILQEKLPPKQAELLLDYLAYAQSVMA
jgi:hypothetical protein